MDSLEYCTQTPFTVIYCINRTDVYRVNVPCRAFSVFPSGAWRQQHLCLQSGDTEVSGCSWTRWLVWFWEVPSAWSPGLPPLWSREPSRHRWEDVPRQNPSVSLVQSGRVYILACRCRWSRMEKGHQGDEGPAAAPLCEKKSLSVKIEVEKIIISLFIFLIINTYMHTNLFACVCLHSRLCEDFPWHNALPQD